jgi:hypothetical protein
MKLAISLFLPMFLLNALAAGAADMALEAKLVWGTNDDKTDANCKPVDADLAGKLHGMFKWKNYYEITNRTAMMPLDQMCDLKMSDRCTLKLKNVGESRIEVHCIGQGKQVHEGAYMLAPTAWVVLGGNCTNNTAWFIGLRAVDDSKRAVTKN